MTIRRLATMFLGVALLAAACGDDDDAATPTASLDGSPAASDDEVEDTPAARPTATSTPEDPLQQPHAETLFKGWPKTDRATLTVDPREIRQGCFGKDCIVALDAPGETSIPIDLVFEDPPTATFIPSSAAEYADQVPVAVVVVNDEPRGYPLHILTWHEIVNDRIGGIPVVVTFCPLCNTALSFERTLDDTILDFSVSGNLRNSDLIMYDRQTESWWQQATGEGIAGVHAGTQLEPIATSVVSFADFRLRYPEAVVLSEQTGTDRSYGYNPYVGYDTFGTRPFLFDGEIDDRLDGLERVVALRFEDEQLAVPFSELANSRVANVTVGGSPVVVLWASGTASALDDNFIPDARDVGAAVAYAATVDGRVLTFEPGLDNGTFIDTATGSTWTLTGLAISGALSGAQLQVVEHTTQFWFSWAAFFPATGVWSGG